VRLRLDVRDLLLASWAADPASVARVLPAGLEPAELDGRTLVSIGFLRYAGGRLGPLPLPPFRQLNVRLYTEWEGEPAVFFPTTRVSLLGLPAPLFGAPSRFARLRLDHGLAEASGLGISLRYRVGEPADAGPLGRHELGLFESGGLRSLRIRRPGAHWRRAEPATGSRADLLVAYGFEPAGPPELLYTEGTSFETEVPPERLT
jgi:hypothetical protein